MHVKTGVIATGLSVVAGSVDAIALNETGRFVSHMTGTTTHTASHLSDGSMLLVLLGALAIVAFLAGAAATGVVITAPGPRAAAHANTVARLVATEAIIIAAAGLTMILFPKGTWTGMLTVALLASAMGLQNATTTYLLKPFERTTHVTSNMTDLGSEIGMRLRGLAGLRSSEVLAAPDGDAMASAAICIAGFAIGGLGGAAVAHGLGSWSGLCAAILPMLLAAITASGGLLPKDA